MTGMRRKTQWRKTLYENHGLPDNYTSGCFLEELRKNSKPNNVTLREALNLGGSVSIKLSIVVLFVNIFVWLYNGWTSANHVFFSSSALMMIGYCVYIQDSQDTFGRILSDSRTVVIFLVFGYILSPVLKTLTETVSTDTIYAMAIFMYFVHLVFSKHKGVALSESLSITSSIFGSLMLASRLASPLHAFSLLTLSVQCFVLLPFFLARIHSLLPISVALVVATFYLLLHVSFMLSRVFLLAAIFVQAVCPLLYVRWQKYKENIYGPWDEAIIST